MCSADQRSRRTIAEVIFVNVAPIVERNAVVISKCLSRDKVWSYVRQRGDCLSYTHIVWWLIAITRPPTHGSAVGPRGFGTTQHSDTISGTDFGLKFTSLAITRIKHRASIGK